MIFHEPAQVLACERPIGNETDIARPVRYFPGFANRDTGRDRFAVKPLQVAPAPEPLFEDRLKDQRIEHGRPSPTGWLKLRSELLTPQPVVAMVAFRRSARGRGNGCSAA